MLFNISGFYGNDEVVWRKLFLAIYSYGNNTQHCLSSGWLDEYTEFQVIRQNGIDNFEVIDSAYFNETRDMNGCFDEILELLETWSDNKERKANKNGDYSDNVPVIIHIGTGMPNDNKFELTNTIGKIKSLNFHDGNPFFMNFQLSPNVKQSIGCSMSHFRVNR